MLLRRQRRDVIIGQVHDGTLFAPRAKTVRIFGLNSEAIFMVHLADDDPVIVSAVVIESPLVALITTLLRDLQIIHHLAFQAVQCYR